MNERQQRAAKEWKSQSTEESRGSGVGREGRREQGVQYRGKHLVTFGRIVEGESEE